ncbi:hypothetical protein Patl1_35642 [Pistacia atlantica]|nr:hypothetical protein Patl1_35642 [Pistacia atlantica]
MKMSGDAKYSSLMASPSTTEYEAKEETPKISQNVNSYSSQFAFAELEQTSVKVDIQQVRPNVIDLENDVPLVVILSDDEDEGERRPSNPLCEVRGYAERTIQVEERVGLAVESDFENYEDVGVEENKVRGYAERAIQVEEKVSLDGESDAEKDKGVGVGENKVSAYAEETMQIEDKVCMVKLLSRKIGVFMLVLKKMIITKPRLKAMI